MSQTRSNGTFYKSTSSLPSLKSSGKKKVDEDPVERAYKGKRREGLWEKKDSNSFKEADKN